MEKKIVVDKNNRDGAEGYKSVVVQLARGWSIASSVDLGKDKQEYTLRRPKDAD